MANLYTTMTGDADTGDDTSTPEEEEERTAEISVLLTRLLFLMFADDASMHRWRSGQFKNWIKTRTRPDGSDLGAQLNALFDTLNTPEIRRSKRLDEAMAAFPYVNGELFAIRMATESFTAEMRDALLEACEFDWSRISPAVFGSLFQTVKSREARHAAGEHYTSEENILKTLRPLFLDNLRKRIESATSAPQLERIHEEMRHMRFVDPACGCGNFLVVAYREMRALELDLLIRLRDRRGESNQTVLDAAELLNVSLDQFVGIELNWWPAKIAQTAMFLVDHQANQAMTHALGGAPDRLPIEIAATIHHTNALTSDWEKLLPGPGPLTFVFGNPPFLGRDRTTEPQKAELRTAWETENVGHLDFVTAWHAKTLKYMADREGEWAYVTTNSITQGEPVEALFRAVEEAGWHIKFAHRTFRWTSESRSDERAVVHVVIVGFTRDTSVPPRLFSYASVSASPEEVKVAHRINGYLSDADNLYVVGRSKPLSPELAPVAYGSMPRDSGNLIVEPEDYDLVAKDPVAAKYVRRYVGARELIHNEHRWCLWMVDLDAADVNRSQVLRERLKANAEFRSKSNAASTRKAAQTPQLFVQNGQPKVPYLCIPAHFSETRRYATVDHFDADVIASNANFTTIDPDGFVFAVISSTMFITWQRNVGGRLKSDLRFAKELVWNTLPLPTVDGALRKRIIAAGERVLAARALHPDRSLANHYHPLAMAPELLKAHQDLDKVVDKAFGWDGRTRLDEAKRLKMLFEQYAALIATEA
ncbi:GcrY protein [Aeromicrobium senzhongii]|uniref:site-specific DNA-methyltransferase (adenine-specific) n=2 Tax=Aeromicrobium senzhongii TaxID=2663859 RepID=A0ABX6SX72_9ACTN|nr:GcrY protein [Aeromicrobium senzhongii]QNL95807.1 GcrY protein [Aeromicrobium senzhongii]